MSELTTFDLQKIFDQPGLEHFFTRLPSPLNTDAVSFCLYARNGLYAIANQIRALDNKRNIALVPAYSCGDEIESLHNAGFEINIYNIKSDLQVDIDNLISKISNQTGIILVTHYFGFPQTEIIKIKELTQTHSSFLIEDCAHAMGSQLEDTPLGTIGDASIFSFRKFMDVPHGGAIVVNHPQLTPPKFDEASPQAINLDLFLFIGMKNKFFPPGDSIKQIYNQLGLEFPSLHGPRLNNYGGYKLALSNLSKHFILRTDTHSIIQNRRTLFQTYLDFFKQNLKSSTCFIFQDLPVGIVPSFFPLLVNDSEECNRFLSDQGFFYTQPFWSYLHNYVDWNQYPHVRDLKTHILAIPLTKSIPEEKLARLTLQLQEWVL